MEKLPAGEDCATAGAIIASANRAAGPPAETRQRTSAVEHVNKAGHVEMLNVRQR